MRNVYYAEERNQTVLYNPRVDPCVQANNTLAHPLKHYKLVYLSCSSVRIHTDVLFPFPVNLCWQIEKNKNKQKKNITNLCRVLLELD